MVGMRNIITLNTNLNVTLKNITFKLHFKNEAATYAFFKKEIARWSFFSPYLIFGTRTFWKPGVGYLSARGVTAEICARTHASGALGDLLTLLEKHSETKSPASIFKSREWNIHVLQRDIVAGAERTVPACLSLGMHRRIYVPAVKPAFRDTNSHQSD